MSNNLALGSENLYPPTTYPTVTDLSGKFGYAAKLSSGLAVVCDSQGERPLGIIRQSTSSTAAHGVEIANTPGMLVTGIASATAVTNKGDEITVGSDGRLESAGSSDVVIGFSDRSAAVGESFGVYLTHFYVKS
jgi:hypothetical protein